MRLRLLPFWFWLAGAGMSGSVLGLGVFTFVYGNGPSYMSSDPRACANCHTMREQFDGWNHSSHKDAATCNDCHLPHNIAAKYLAKSLNGWHHSKAFTTGDYPDPIRIKPYNRRILEHNCLRCHEDMTYQMSHAGEDDATDCLHCHSDVGHKH